MADELTREYVLTRWVYSELNSPEQGDKYGDVGDLRAKAAGSVPFEALSDHERALLLNKWQVRGFHGGVIAAALNGVTHFQLQHWTKAQLGSTYILSHFNDWLGEDYAVGGTTFKEWIEARPIGDLPEHHPLRTADAPFQQRHPMTVARVRLIPVPNRPKEIIVVSDPERYVPLDGYHRAAQFWKTADAHFTLEVYVPVV